MDALGSVGTDLRRAIAPPALAEVGGMPDDAGWTAGARSESAWVGCATSRSEERAAQDEGARGEMAAAVNVGGMD